MGYRPDQPKRSGRHPTIQRSSQETSSAISLGKKYSQPSRARLGLRSIFSPATARSGRICDIRARRCVRIHLLGQDRGVTHMMLRTDGRPELRSTPFPALIVIVLAVAVLAACASARAPALTATRQVHVSPVAADGKPVTGFRTTMTVSHAGCEPGSEAIGLAYRCFAGNELYDPCWAERAPTPSVLCLAQPWSVTDIRLEVDAPLSAIPPDRAQRALGPGAGERAAMRAGPGRPQPVRRPGHRLLLRRPAVAAARADNDYCCVARDECDRDRGQAGARAVGADQDRLVRHPGQLPLACAAPGQAAVVSQGGRPGRRATAIRSKQVQVWAVGDRA